MKRSFPRRSFALVFITALAVLAGLFAHRSQAAAIYIVHGPAKDVCPTTGRQAAAVYQDSSFGSELHGFIDRETISISIQFPDGRIFSLADTVLLDGVVDMPPHYRSIIEADVAGDVYFEFPVTNRWPYGCYELTAVGAGSGQRATGYLVVAPRVSSGPAASPAKLAVWNNGTFDAFAPHDSLVNIHGTFFGPNEPIDVWITQPDGTVLGYPRQVASDVGNFQSSFQFTSANQTGKYMFTALGKWSGYQVFAPFELRAKPSVEQGWAELSVAFPYPASTTQNRLVVIVGKLFQPGEEVGLWMTLPDNAVRGLPTQIADGNGDFYVEIQLDERLPVGSYDVTASGLRSGRLQIATFDIREGQFNPVPPSAPPAPLAPQVTGTNTGGASLGGPTNLGAATGNPGPELSPADSSAPACSSPDQLWTQDC
jgi:hypothetical protein